MLKIRSTVTVLCAHPFSRKLISGGQTIEEAANRTEIRGRASDDTILSWMRSVNATKADAHFWGSYHKPSPGRFDPHSHNLGSKTLTLGD